MLLAALCLPLIGVVGCGQVESTGTSSLTVEMRDLVGARGSELSAELRKDVDYGQTAPTWTFLTATVTSSPFAFTDTVGQLPEGEFDLVVTAGSAGKSQVEKVKGQGCEMRLVLAEGAQVTISIDGLNQFGTGYGECNATTSR
jgi:hypothetical protein